MPEHNFIKIFIKSSLFCRQSFILSYHLLGFLEFISTQELYSLEMEKTE